ncbi:MAG: CarD family transcriptional regulator, partial [Chloroflexota bacterium]
MEILLDQIRSQPAYRALLDALKAGQSLTGLGLPRAARLPVLAALHADLGQPVVLVTDRADHALQLHDEMAFWLPEVARYLFSEPNPLFYEEAAWGNATRRERLQTLTTLARYHLPFAEKPSMPPVIVTSARALMTRTLPRRDFLKASKQLKVGQNIPPKGLLEEWLRIGYQPAETVLEPGQFSHRGGLLDIWPQPESRPMRLDFFGDEIDAIRVFDPASQRTVEKLESILVTPAREFVLSGKSDVSDHLSEFHISLLHGFPASLLEYLPSGSLVMVDDLSLLESAVVEFEEQAVKFRSESIAEGTLEAGFPVPYIPWPELADRLQDCSCLEMGHSTAEEMVGGQESKGSLSAEFGHIERFGGRLKPFIEFLAHIVSGGNSVVVVSRQASRLQELWAEQTTEDGRQTSGLDPSSVIFVEASLSAGWQLGNLLLVTDSEIFGWERPQPRTRPRPSAETPEMAYADLNPGDWIVHVDYGIGHFAGLGRRTLEGLEREFLCVEYQNGDQVYVPIHQADRLTRYVGPGGAP